MTKQQETDELIARLEKALVQIRNVCRDNKASTCNHKMALMFVEGVADLALRSRAMTDEGRG